MPGRFVPRPNATNVAAVGRRRGILMSCMSPSCLRYCNVCKQRIVPPQRELYERILSSYLFSSGRVQLCQLFRQITLPAGLLLSELLFLDRLRRPAAGQTARIEPQGQDGEVQDLLGSRNSREDQKSEGGRALRNALGSTPWLVLTCVNEFPY